MTRAYMQGFELGTTMAEVNSLSIDTMGGANIGLASVSASTLGNGGRSLKIASTVAGTNTLSSTPPLLTSANLIAASQVSFGFRAKLNQAYNQPAAYGRTGLGVDNAAGSYGLFMLRNGTTTSLACLLSYNNGTNSVAFNVPDLLPHYWTFTAVKTTGTTYNITLRIDRNIVAQATGTITWQAQSLINYACTYSAATAGQGQPFDEMDDVYVNYDEGPLGDLIIYRAPAATDAQAQWIPYGAASNHAAIDKIDLTSTSGIQSSTSGAADLYGITDPGFARRSIYAANTTVYGTGDGVVTVTPTQKSGAASVSGTPVALNAFGGVATTGWNQTLAGTPISNFQFGVTRS